MSLVPTFFSRTATTVIAVLLLLVLVWVIYMLGPTALERWLR